MSVVTTQCCFRMLHCRSIKMATAIVMVISTHTTRCPLTHKTRLHTDSARSWVHSNFEANKWGCLVFMVRWSVWSCVTFNPGQFWFVQFRSTQTWVEWPSLAMSWMSQDLSIHTEWHKMSASACRDRIIQRACEGPCSSEYQWQKRFLSNAWLSRLTCKSPCPYRLLQMYPFCSVAMNSSQRRATTPIDFCVCHLWPARITLQIYTPPDPEKCFQLPPAGVNLLCWADWNGTPRTLDKATKLRHRATATATAAAAINNIQVWLA